MSCGSELKPTSESAAAPVKVASGDFERTVGEVGKRIEVGMRKFGGFVEREATQEKNHLVKKWDSTFGPFAPVVSGALGCVGLVVAILVIDSLAGSGEHRRFWNQLADFILEYILLFIALIFMSSFQNYLNRRYRRTFRWVSPALTAIAFAAWFWIFSRVLFMAGREFENDLVIDLGRFFEFMVPVVFILALAIGYIVQLALHAVRQAAASP